MASREHTAKRRGLYPQRTAPAALAESGEIAPIDLARYGRRAGEIIARAAQLPRRSSRRPRSR